MSAGGQHTCGIKTDGTLWCWGQNRYGQLGVGGEIKQAGTPTQVGQHDDWTQVSAGADHTCAARTDHTLWCWGDGQDGQLGLGLDSGGFPPRKKWYPAKVKYGAVWVTVSAGQYFTCATRIDASLWCWGGNHWGQLGIGGNRSRYRPMRAGMDNDWASVTAGDDHTCGLQTGGTAWCWGANRYGQIGDGTRHRAWQPTQVGADSDWVGVSAGGQYSCGVKTDGTGWCWGLNDRHQLGDGTTVDHDVPVQAAPGELFSSVSAGESHTCGVLADATAWCWGSNLQGQAGQGRRAGRLLDPGPVRSHAAWSSVGLGRATSCGIQTDGSAWCWGSNKYGKLGDGTNIDRYRPTRVVD